MLFKDSLHLRVDLFGCGSNVSSLRSEFVMLERVVMLDVLLQGLLVREYDLCWRSVHKTYLV